MHIVGPPHALHHIMGLRLFTLEGRISSFVSSRVESPKLNSQAIVHYMCTHRVSSVPTELIVADFFVYVSVPFAEHCLKDIVAYTKG